VCVITKEKTDMYRGYEKPNERGVKEQKYNFDKGTTPWTKEQIRDMIVREGKFRSLLDSNDDTDSAVINSFRRPRGWKSERDRCSCRQDGHKRDLSMCCSAK
jgi:hypothetical protein